MIGDKKEVYFWEYCKKCKYEKLPECEDPCWDCLIEAAREDSHKPVKFEEKDGK